MNNNSWSRGYDCGFFVEGVPGEVIATIPTESVQDKVAAGRATLIAAAPEMLLALKHLIAGGCPEFAKEYVLAAISKAEGK